MVLGQSRYERVFLKDSQKAQGRGQGGSESFHSVLSDFWTVCIYHPFRLGGRYWMPTWPTVV